jgi:hypothetical protein
MYVCMYVCMYVFFPYCIDFKSIPLNTYIKQYENN